MAGPGGGVRCATCRRDVPGWSECLPGLRSPLSLDLYMWLPYRTFTLKKVTALRWSDLETLGNEGCVGVTLCGGGGVGLEGRRSPFAMVISGPGVLPAGREKIRRAQGSRRESGCRGSTLVWLCVNETVGPDAARGLHAALPGAAL